MFCENVNNHQSLANDQRLSFFFSISSYNLHKTRIIEKIGTIIHLNFSEEATHNMQIILHSLSSQMHLSGNFRPPSVREKCHICRIFFKQKTLKYVCNNIETTKVFTVFFRPYNSNVRLIRNTNCQLQIELQFSFDVYQIIHLSFVQHGKKLKIEN